MSDAQFREWFRKREPQLRDAGFSPYVLLTAGAYRDADGTRRSSEPSIRDVKWQAWEVFRTSGKGEMRAAERIVDGILAAARRPGDGRADQHMNSARAVGEYTHRLKPMGSRVRVGV